MDETSKFLAATAALTGAAAGVADDESVEGVDIGDEGELVAKATEPVAGLNGKIIPVKGKIIGLAVPKGATAPAAKVAW